MTAMPGQEAAARPSTELPLVVLDGAPRARGRQHGEMFRERIRGRVARLREKLDTGYSGSAERAQQVMQAIGERSPDLHAEILGIAEGAQMIDADILLLSAFEITGDVTAGCTMIGLSDGSSAIVAQNWDAAPGTGDEIAVMVHRENRRPRLALVASIGGIGWVGANAHGLALANTDLMLRGSQDALPSQVIRRLVLEQKSTAEAVTLLRTLRHPGGRSYLVGDSAGDMRCIEVATGATALLAASHAIAHTNHALDPDIAKTEDTAAVARVYPTSRGRLHRAVGLARDAEATAAVARSILCDGQGAPDSICKSWSAAERTETTFAMIFETASGTLHVGRSAHAMTHSISLGGA